MPRPFLHKKQRKSNLSVQVALTFGAGDGTIEQRSQSKNKGERGTSEACSTRSRALRWNESR